MKRGCILAFSQSALLSVKQFRDLHCRQPVMLKDYSLALRLNEHCIRIQVYLCNVLGKIVFLRTFPCLPNTHSCVGAGGTHLENVSEIKHIKRTFTTHSDSLMEYMYVLPTQTFGKILMTCFAVAVILCINTFAAVTSMNSCILAKGRLPHIK